MSLTEIITRIHTAEAKAGREKGSTKLIAVSKVQPDERVALILDEGHRVFGENRVQEAAGKWPAFREAFARVAQEIGQCPDLYIQVNTGEEPQKAGVLPAEADGFIADALAMDLPVKGLMCIPPVDEEPSLHFALLGKIAARNGVSGLSMGMSGDFERAVALGATHVRVGSAIFGQRVPAT